jgi:hypothetical protein
VDGFCVLMVGSSLFGASKVISVLRSLAACPVSSNEARADRAGATVISARMYSQPRWCSFLRSFGMPGK